MDVIGLARGTVRLVPYQSEWKELFDKEYMRLRVALRDESLQMEHVGSTAIEGMDAKPIIDMLLAVDDLSRSRVLTSQLQALGYQLKTDDDVPERVFLIKGPSARRTHHLSVTESDSEYWSHHILFRDYLRAHPDVAEEYMTLKQKLAELYPDDRYAYTEGKKGFVDKIYEQAKLE